MNGTSSKRRWGVLPALALALWWGQGTFAAPKPAVPPVKPIALNAPETLRESAKYGVYLQAARIGAMATRTFDTRNEGKPALRVEADTSLKLAALGAPVEQVIAMQQLMDPSGKPLFTRLDMTSMGRRTVIEARYEAERVVCDIDAGGQKSKKIVPIPKGVTLEGDPQLSPAGDQVLKVGQKETVYFFEPLNLSIHKVETEVLRSEKRTLGGKEIEVFLLKSTSSATGSSESWVDAKGQLLEDTNQLGLRIVREDVEAEGPVTAYVPPKDFAVATSVMTNVRLKDPRTLSALRLRLSGVPEERLFLSDTRQKISERAKDGDRWSALYQLISRPLPERCLPLAKPGDDTPGLGDAVYLGLDDPQIRSRAKELVQKETDRGIVARRIRSWVNGHMKKPNNVGTPRSAGEIMRSRDGVCRDYATLFTAVARAAGLPTRVCSGLIYHEGAFFYHAWVECRLTGEADGWYAFDPTLKDDFVDATHIKLAQGDPVEMYGAVAAVGQLKAEILSSEP